MGTSATKWSGGGSPKGVPSVSEVHKREGSTFIHWSNEFICKILHKGNLLKNTALSKSQATAAERHGKERQIFWHTSVAKFDTPVVFKGKLPANERRTKDILLAKFLSREESESSCQWVQCKQACIVLAGTVVPQHPKSKRKDFRDKVGSDWEMLPKGNFRTKQQPTATFRVPGLFVLLAAKRT